MSIIYCELHDLRWDSDMKDECPACENEPPPKAEENMTQSPLQIANDIVEACPGTGKLTSAQRMLLKGEISEALSKQQQTGYKNGYVDGYTNGSHEVTPHKYAEATAGSKLVDIMEKP